MAATSCEVCGRMQNPTHLRVMASSIAELAWRCTFVAEALTVPGRSPSGHVLFHMLKHVIGCGTAELCQCWHRRRRRRVCTVVSAFPAASGMPVNLAQAEGCQMCMCCDTGVWIGGGVVFLSVGLIRRSAPRGRGSKWAGLRQLGSWVVLYYAVLRQVSAAACCCLD
jgi:hypothetical protein